MSSAVREGLLNPEQEERNRRAFEGWLLRKQEERKVKETSHTGCLLFVALFVQRQHEAKEQALKAADIERVQQQKRLMANRAYQQWLSNKNQEQQQRQKDQRIEKELQVLYAGQREAEQRKAQDSFLSWKRRKDMERDLQHERTIESEGVTLVAKQTPVLPGYCSVWSCDEQLADHMLASVQET